MKSCVIIPCYNVGAIISSIVEELKKLACEVVIVDDGSSDLTADMAFASGATVLRNKDNFGKGASLRRGFKYALAFDYDNIITMDGDGQHLPEDVVNFLEARRLDPNADVILGNRMDNPAGMPFVRYLTNKVMSKFISYVSNQRIPDSQSGFRLIKANILKDLQLKSDKFEIESEIIIKAAKRGYKIISIPIRSVYKNSKSQINPFIDTLRFIKFIKSYLFTPLEIPNQTLTNRRHREL